MEECSTLKYYIYKPLKDYTSYIPKDYFFEYKTTRRLKVDGGILRIGEYQQKVTHLLESDNSIGFRIKGILKN